MNKIPQWRKEFDKHFTTGIKSSYLTKEWVFFIETQIALASEKAYNKWWLEAKEDAVMWEI